VLLRFFALAGARFLSCIWFWSAGEGASASVSEQGSSLLPEALLVLFTALAGPRERSFIFALDLQYKIN
jgi:hypothetical protein